MQWLEMHTHRMNSALFQNLSDKFSCSQLHVQDPTQVLIKMQPKTNLRKLKDITKLY